MRAIQSISVGQAAIVEIPDAKLTPDSILVRPTCVANNPCDYIVTDLEGFSDKEQVVGCDYAGIVEQIGSNVNTSLKAGDRVCGAVAGGIGCDVSKGAFADLIPAYGDFCFRIPAGVSDAEAATLGVGLSTVAMVLYDNFGFPLPDEDPKYGEGKTLFVYGGSTTTGLLIMQFAKLSGFRVITTCSPKNFDLAQARGAGEAYDYHDLDECAAHIKASVADELRYALVCIMGEGPAKLCAKILSPNGGTYVTLVPGQCLRSDVKTIMTYGEAPMCDAYKSMTGIARQTPEEKQLGQRFLPMALKLIGEGKIKAPPFELREGLEGALQGIEDLRNGLISGKKIVSRLQ